MVRKRREENTTNLRARMDVTVDPVNKQWLNGEIKKKVFFNRSHGVDYCISIVRQVFIEREDQMIELAKSLPLTAIREDIDGRVKDATKGDTTEGS